MYLNSEQQIFARAPAKLILSGEHAVVYGQPALAVAVDMMAETTLAWDSEHHSIAFYLMNLGYTSSMTLQKLHELKLRAQNRYLKFLNGECTIRDVLLRSFELMQYAFIQVIDRLNITLPRGLEIRTNSSIPIGCGMGSSAASIVSITHALIKLFELDLQLEQSWQLNKDAENLQHGYSSGLDLYLSMHGGCNRFVDGKAESRSIPEFPMCIVNTGKPEVTTGQCVSDVAQRFRGDNLLWRAFAAVTDSFDVALQQNNVDEIKRSIRENHLLLTRIGVVPAKVQEFVKEIESVGAVAKVCGSGSTVGDNAGVVLAVANEDISPICQRFGYSLMHVNANVTGVE